MKKIFWIVLPLTCFTGCAKLAHLQELLTLKAYSEGKDDQAKYVEQQDRNFEKLLAALKNDMQPYKDQKTFLKEFGSPVFSQSIERDGKAYELWLYRYTVKYFDSEKVYLYFDKEGNLQDWKHEIPQPAQLSRQKN